MITAQLHSSTHEKNFQRVMFIEIDWSRGGACWFFNGKKKTIFQN